jgi:hypothetical protein
MVSPELGIVGIETLLLVGPHRTGKKGVQIWHHDGMGRREVVAKPHRHFLKVMMAQSIWKKARNTLI